jgi:short-subunit dehydrogenase
VRIFITGATSGIGAELAKQYAGPGVRLGLVGRRVDKLEATASACRAKGAEVDLYPVDVTDGPGMAKAAKAFVDATKGVDLVIANAGVGGELAHDDDLAKGDAAPFVNMMNINVAGVLNTLVPFVPSMVARGSGRLVAVASVAGYRAMPGFSTYCASKIAVRTLLEGFGWSLARRGVGVTCINPGFVDSEMTAGASFPMPFRLGTEEAVWRIRRAIERGDRSYAFPAPTALGAWSLQFVPSFLVGWVGGMFQPRRAPAGV